MNRKQRENKRSRVISLLFALAMGLYGAAGQPGRNSMIVIGLGMGASLCYAFSEWPMKNGLSIPERMGRWGALLLLSCGSGGWYVYQFWPEVKPIVHAVT